MRTELRPIGDQVEFLLYGLDERCREAALSLGFQGAPERMARRFPADSPHLDRIYANFARSAEMLIAQRAVLRPAPWDEALARFLGWVDGAAIDWWLVGSAALAVRGLPVTPGDIDLATDEDGAFRLGELLLDHLIEPVTTNDGWVARAFGRAFPGACLEWVGGVRGWVDAMAPTDFGPYAEQRREQIVWRGHRLAVPPLDLQLAVNEHRGRSERAAAIRAWLTIERSA